MGDQMTLGPTEERVEEIGRLLASAASEVGCLLGELGDYRDSLTGRRRLWANRAAGRLTHSGRVSVGEIPVMLEHLATQVRQSHSEASESAGGDAEATTPDTPKP